MNMLMLIYIYMYIYIYTYICTCIYIYIYILPNNHMIMYEPYLGRARWVGVYCECSHIYIYLCVYLWAQTYMKTRYIL